MWFVDSFPTPLRTRLPHGILNYRWLYNLARMISKNTSSEILGMRKLSMALFKELVALNMEKKKKLRTSTNASLLSSINSLLKLLL
jgi:hypothetical protein